MAYLRASAGPPITPEELQTIARVFGLRLPPEDIDPLSTALRDQLASVETLSSLDLTDVQPVLQFDPRWHD
jgi:Asp-tRNA(Asn)/Glu-tRNA(Gln) amidotransferase C subunit